MGYLGNVNNITLIPNSYLIRRLCGACRRFAFISGISLASVLSGQVVVGITSPSFEGTGDPWLTPDGWSGVSGSTNATFRWLSGTAGNEVHTGTRAFRISTPDVGTTQARIQQTNASRFSVTTGETYTVSLWAKGTGLDLATDRIRVVIEWWNAAGTGTLGTSNGSLLSLSSNDTWQEYSVALTATAPANAVTAKILIFFERAAGSTSVTPEITFDDISVTVPSSIPEPSTAAWLFGASVLAASVIMRRAR